MKKANQLSQKNRRKLIRFIIYLIFAENYQSIKKIFENDYVYFVLLCTATIYLSTPPHPLRVVISIGSAICFAIGIYNVKRTILLFKRVEN